MHKFTDKQLPHHITSDKCLYITQMISSPYTVVHPVTQTSVTSTVSPQQKNPITLPATQQPQNPDEQGH